MEIPPDLYIKSSLEPGTVYYFVNDNITSPEPHYHILLNKNPKNEPLLLLVIASSKVEKVKRRRKNLPPETLVEISPDEYRHFSVDTIIDCNNVFEIDFHRLTKKLAAGELKIKNTIDISIVEKLRNALIKSPMISKSLKGIIQ